MPSGLDDGQCIAASPDLDIEIVDTTEHYVYPLVRDQEIPADIRRECYFFDDVSPAEMDELMRNAKGQAKILGFGGSPTGEGEGEWRFAEPSSEVFGDLVPDESLTDDDLCVVKRDDDGGLYGLAGAWMSTGKIGLDPHASGVPAPREVEVSLVGLGPLVQHHQDFVKRPRALQSVGVLLASTRCNLEDERSGVSPSRCVFFT